MDPRQGLPTATHDTDNGAAEHEHDNGAADLGRGEEAGLEPVDLESGSVEDDLEAGPYQQDEDLESDVHDDREDGAPPPLEHAMPDGELAEEQLEVGRPEEPEPEEGEDEEEFEREVEESISAGRGGGRGRGGRRRGYDGGSGAGGSGGGELVAPGTTAVAERRPGLISRFIGFLQGSWRELQRVQWPDRRQVFQATGVVIGFVILAAVFLGVADWVSGKLVTFVLK